MAKSKKLTRKLRHKRDVAEKRRARAFYRMREQNRQDDADLLQESSTGVVVSTVTALVTIAGITAAVYHAIKTIINV